MVLKRGIRSINYGFRRDYGAVDEGGRKRLVSRLCGTRQREDNHQTESDEKLHEETPFSMDAR